MKLMTLFAPLSLLAGVLAGEPPNESKDTTASALSSSVPSDESESGSAKDEYPRFSVVGDWKVKHPQWKDTIVIRPNGTLLAKRQGSTGRWILTAEGGTPLLVIRWDLYGTESVSMVTTDHFRGQRRPGRFIDMRRIKGKVLGMTESDDDAPVSALIKPEE